MKRLRKLLQRNPAERALFFEALRCLLWAKFMIHSVPFRRVALRYGQPTAESPATISATERETVVKVSWAVETAARYVRLGFVCLPQAMAAQRMLHRRGIANTLYLGVAPNEKKPEAIKAHAWLRAGDKILTGKGESQRHRTLARFADIPATFR